MLRLLPLLLCVALVGCPEPDRTLIDCSQYIGDSWEPELGPEEQELLVRINYARGTGTECNGDWWDPVDAVTSNDELSCAARLHAKNMLEQDFFDHIAPDGTSPADRAETTGYPGDAVSENISCGRDDGDATGYALIESTSGHCENIMDPEAVVVGLGGYTGPPTESNGWRNCWVMLFGKPAD